MSAPDAKAQRLARRAAHVDWSKMIDPYTGEQYGPEMVTGLWSTDRGTADRTCRILHYTANGDGSSVAVAAAEMLPFLVEAARDPDVTVRFGILRAIADIADTGNTAPTAQVAPILRGKWRPTVDPAWPPAWERAAEELLPLLDDDDDIVRVGAVGALAQSAAHADTLIPRLRTLFDHEPDLWVAESLVLAIGELARHSTRRRDEALGWLRHRMTVGPKEAEPDVDQDIDAWIAWDEEIRHDVRLKAVAALRRALPDDDDPRYASVTTDALLASASASATTSASASAEPPVEYHSAQVDVITEADRRLGADLPGRLALARTLLRHHGTTERGGGLRIAAGLMSRWRSAVPELLPAVAELVDDACVENRVFALRVLAMCGAAARPWADLVATHLGAAREPHELGREHAVRALSRMGDDRCVPALVELLAARGAFALDPTGSPDRRWSSGDIGLDEALAPFAAHTGVLLDPLLAHIQQTANRWHPYLSIPRQWHRDGGDVVPRLIELLDSDETLMVAAHALLRMDAGAVAAAHRARLRARLGPPAGRRDGDLAYLSPFEYHALTGDDEPVHALLRPSDNRGFPEPGPRLSEPTLLRACVTLGGSLDASAADRLRELFHAALSGKPQRWSDAPKGAVERARALWRVTGDADEVLPALWELTVRSALEVYQTPGSVAALELLAEVAATRPPVAERVARRLRATAEQRVGHDNRFDAMRTVQSLWQLTSDPQQVAPTLIALTRICPPPGSADPTILAPLRLLAEVAATDPASVSPAAPLLRALLDADERPVRHDHWRAVERDDALRTAVRAVLDAAAAGIGDATAPRT